MASREYVCLILWLLATCAYCKVKHRRDTRHNFKVEELRVWTGQSVNLRCGDDFIDNIRRFWRKDSEILAAANVVMTNDERFSVYENSVELILKNVTMEDEGSYICTVNSRPRYKLIYQVEVIELKCGHPENPVDGGIKIISLGSNTTNAASYDSEEESADGSNATIFRYGSRIQYYCNKGFAIVGDAMRTCADPYKGGWTGEAPTCEPTFLAALRQRIGSIEDRMHGSQADNKGVAKLDLKMTTIESRMTKLEEEANASSKNLERIQGLDAEIHRLKTAVNLDLQHAEWKTTLGHEMAHLGAKDGHIISEFAWSVSGIYDKIDQHRAEKIKYVESPPFYTHIPGYKMQLHLYPDDGGSGYFGMYAVLLQGEFDEFITWPFTSKYQMAMISRDENEVTMDIVVPSRVPACNFGRPPPDNILGCGFAKFMSHEDFKNKEKLYLYGKDVLMKITIYLDWH